MTRRIIEWSEPAPAAESPRPEFADRDAAVVELEALRERAGRTLIQLLTSVGDELGLFQDLATNGPSTSPELATRTNLDEASVSEWLAAMLAAGNLEYDPMCHRFSLPSDFDVESHAAVEGESS